METAFPWDEPTFAGDYRNAVQTNAYNAYYERPAIQSLLSDLKNKKVLDAGCGSGMLAEWLQMQGAEVTAIDRSASMIRIVEQRLGNKIRARTADFGQKLDFLPDNEFNTVVASLSLHYLSEWEIPFNEFHRILKPGGLFVFSTHHPYMDFSKSHKGSYHEVEYIEETWNHFSDKPVQVGFYRRPLSNIFNTLKETGFQIDKLIEPIPVAECKIHHPQDYYTLLTKPVFIIISAIVL